MQRVFSFRQGDRSEYLAQYILSSFAISVPVPRQEDVGSDFHCSLLRRVGANLIPYLPFNIQIKSDSADLRKNGITFGGTTKTGAWRQHEIENLCQTDMPFLVGVVSKEDQRLDLFSTITRYFVCTNWSGKGHPREVALIPYTPVGEIHLGNGEIVDLDEVPGMPKTLWKIPIGQPIVQISITDSEDPDTCEKIKQVLEPYLRMDQENAVLVRIGLGYFEWPLIIRPGEQPREFGIGGVYGPAGSPQLIKQLKVFFKIIANILKIHLANRNKDVILQWIPVLDNLPDNLADPLTKKIFDEVRAFTQETNPTPN